MTTPHPSLADQVELHSAWMRRLARAVAGDAAADDVMQDTWTVIRERRALPGYLAAVVRSIARRYLRGERRRAVREQRTASTHVVPSATEIAARSEIARVLALAVDQLDEPYRTTVVLRYYDDLPAAEIARRAGIPAATVRARLLRGLELLRARLDALGGRERWLGALLPWIRTQAEPTVKLGTLAAFVAMKIALASLVAVCVLALAWIVLMREPPPPVVSTTAATRPGQATQEPPSTAGANEAA